MFGSTVLELSIGLIFTFLMVSLITSSTTEALASALSWRSNTLLQGVKDLLNDQQFTGLAQQIYNHGLVNGLSDGDAKPGTPPKIKPSYIDPKQFADALIDVLGLSPGTAVRDLKIKIDASVTDSQLNRVLNGIVEQTGGNIDSVRDNLATWFDKVMDRLSGVYKRKTQLWSFGIALFLAVFLNVDAVEIAHRLWDQPMMLKSIGPSSTAPAPEAAFEQLKALELPFGWDSSAFKNLKTFPNCLYVIIGWLITAVATLFGAPFWFDALQRIVQLRGTGSKEETNSAPN
jgi:hypothetical protein